MEKFAGSAVLCCALMCYPDGLQEAQLKTNDTGGGGGRQANARTMSSSLFLKRMGREETFLLPPDKERASIYF